MSTARVARMLEMAAELADDERLELAEELGERTPDKLKKLSPAWEAELRRRMSDMDAAEARPNRSRYSAARSPTSSKHLATTGSLRGYIHLVTHEELLARITINPAVCHGKPCIRGHRIWVGLVLGMLEGGMRQDEILSEYPSLEPADIQACLAYASE